VISKVGARYLKRRRFRPKFDADKAAGKFNKSMGKVPILEVGDVQFAQSKVRVYSLRTAIRRFV